MLHCGKQPQSWIENELLKVSYILKTSSPNKSSVIYCCTIICDQLLYNYGDMVNYFVLRRPETDSMNILFGAVCSVQCGFDWKQNAASFELVLRSQMLKKNTT